MKKILVDLGHAMARITLYNKSTYVEVLSPAQEIEGGQIPCANTNFTLTNEAKEAFICALQGKDEPGGS